MSKLICKCGNLISSVVYPSPTQGDLLKQQAFEPLLDEIVESIVAFVKVFETGRNKYSKWLEKRFNGDYPVDTPFGEVISDIVGDHLFSTMLPVSECEKCGRLYIQRENGKDEYLSYLPETKMREPLLAVKNLIEEPSSKSLALKRAKDT